MFERRWEITEWEFMQKIYEQEKMPVEWGDSVIMPTYKENGDIHIEGIT